MGLVSLPSECQIGLMVLNIASQDMSICYDYSFLSDYYFELNPGASIRFFLLKRKWGAAKLDGCFQAPVNLKILIRENDEQAM